MKNARAQISQEVSTCADSGESGHDSSACPFAAGVGDDRDLEGADPIDEALRQCTVAGGHVKHWLVPTAIKVLHHQLDVYLHAAVDGRVVSKHDLPRTTGAEGLGDHSHIASATRRREWMGTRSVGLWTASERPSADAG